MDRVKINQPHEWQPFHDMHGTVGIADMHMDDACAIVYFTEGVVISLEIPKSALDIVRTRFQQRIET